MTSPHLGTIVNYVTHTNRDPALRQAIVIGHAAYAAPNVHLAVLTEDGTNLDLLSLAVPEDPAGLSVGTWHTPPVAEWPTETGG